MGITHDSIEYKSGNLSPEDEVNIQKFKSELVILQDKVLGDLKGQAKPLMEKYGLEGEIMADLKMALLIMPKEKPAPEKKEEDEIPVEEHPDARVILCSFLEKDFVRIRVEKQPLMFIDMVANKMDNVIVTAVESCCPRHVSFSGRGDDGRDVRGKLDVTTGIGAVVYTNNY